jgi:hypothetical protein
MRPVLDSSYFAPVPTLPCRTCIYSASSVITVRISCRVIAAFVFRKPLFINKLYRIYVCYTNITLYKAFGLGTYYPRIRGHTCTILAPWSRVPLQNLRSSASQEIPRIFLNSKVHYRVHKRSLYNKISNWLLSCFVPF